MRENALGSVAECDSEFISTFDYVSIAQGAGRSDDCFDSGGGSNFHAVLKREESVT